MTSELYSQSQSLPSRSLLFSLKESHLKRQLSQQCGSYICAVFKTKILDFEGTHHLETLGKSHDQPQATQ